MPREGSRDPRLPSYPLHIPLHLQWSVEKFKGKDSLKNSGNFSERLLGLVKGYKD